MVDPKDSEMFTHTLKKTTASQGLPQHQILPLDNIIVGYAFGPKKMETMGLIMAEASKALSTVITPVLHEDSSTAKESASNIYFPDDIDDEDARSYSSTRASSIASHRSLRARELNGIQLTFLPDSTTGFIPWVRSTSTAWNADELSMAEEMSMVTNSTTLANTASCTPKTKVESTTCCASYNSMPSPSSHSSLLRLNGTRRHPIRVSFVPIDLDTPLEEQHGGKFDVILHKMTEDILCISKMLRSRQLHNHQGFTEDCHGDRIDEAIQLLNNNVDTDDTMNSESNYILSRHEERAARRIQRLREYKAKSHPSCVLVDSPINILAVMSRADMAEVLSSCLEGVKTTRHGIPVTTPRFKVVEEAQEANVSSLANEMDAAGFTYPLIAKPLTAAGTKSSHHMGIVMARDGLMRLKTPCILQEFANHGGQLFKVYVLGESVWVFSRESLPNLPPGENELPSKDDRREAKSYVEFQRPAGSRCYVEFNSQRPYPTLSDFGMGDAVHVPALPSKTTNDQEVPMSKKPRLHPPYDMQGAVDLASFVTKEEIEPVTNTLRAAFGLDLFGFDVLVKHEQNTSNLDVREILVVDVNYFPGYKEVPHFPSLLAQYLTQKAVETRINV
ncbi:hypothetical protein ACHAXN_005844 [Cyclotella atomus]